MYFDKLSELNNSYLCEVKSLVFDETYSYGGRQASPSDDTSDLRKSAYYKIIRDNNPTIYYSDEHLKKYLLRLASEGCWYVATCNAIIKRYIDNGRESEYENTFGYPIRNEIGNIDFDMLIVDYYSMADNHSWKSNLADFDYFEDYTEKNDGPKNEYDFRDDITGCGTSIKSRKIKYAILKGKYGISISEKEIFYPHYKKIAKLINKGYDVVVSYTDGDVYNMDGSVYCHVLSHAMYVTGVTSDGKYIVSTWGRKCYIDSKDITNGITGMDFVYLKFE